MFSNNKCPIIKKLSVRSFSANNKRNLIVITAIALTTFLLTSVFSVGISYIKSIDNQAIMQRGTAAQILLVNPTEENLTWLKHHNNIQKIGLERQIATAKTEQFKGVNSIFLRWADNIQWQAMSVPAMGGIKGNYPQNSDEIFMPDWLLAYMGIENPQIGMKVSLNCRYGGTTSGHQALSEFENKTFILAGWYQDFSSNRQQRNAVCYISENYWKGSVATENNTRCAASLLFQDNNAAISEYQVISREIALTNDQSLNLLIYSSSGIGTASGLFAIVVLILFCGYLLIYNILFISINNDVHFYGQLKTLGTTKKQIMKIIFIQMEYLCLISIPIGLAVGTIVSTVIVPLGVVGMSGGYAVTNDFVAVSFSPIIYIGATFLAVFTTLMGGLKPANIAGGISPIEAVRYQGNTQVNGQKGNKSPHGNRLYRMAWRNVFRNKKSAILTFLSLFLGLSIYIIIVGLLSSIDVSRITEEYFSKNEDISLELYDYSDPVITAETLETIKKIDGIKQVAIYRVIKPANNGEIFISNTGGEFTPYLEELYEVEPLYLKYQEDYRSGDLWNVSIIGTDESEFDIINETLGGVASYDKFKAGETAFYLLTPDGDKMTSTKELPQSLIFIMCENTFFLNACPVGIGIDVLKLNGGLQTRFPMPSLLVSNEYIEQMRFDSIIAKVKITTDKTSDPLIIEQLSNMFKDMGNIAINSRYEKNEELVESFRIVYMLGGCLSVILLFIGIMNFLNTMSVNVTIRKHEFALLESIGMTKRQIQKMLVFEGIYYWLIPFILIASIGTVIFSGMFLFVKLFLIPYVTYTYPIIPLLLSALIIFSICVVTPLLSYRFFSRKSVVERLREN